MTAPLRLASEDRSNELALARRASDGDHRAFEEIYQANAGRVFGLCLRMSGSRQRAVELTQDVFVRVWQGLHKWRGDSALSSWIYRVTVNLVLSDARDARRRYENELESEDPDPQSGGGHAAAVEGAGKSASQAARTPSILDAIDLERAIAALPDGARRVFVLHDVEGYRHGEIARMTGTAEGTCRAQLHRARKLLMEALER